MDKSLSAGPTVRGGRGIKYPESDGKPMGETGVHVNVMLAVLEMFRRHYRGESTGGSSRQHVSLLRGR